ncbi:MAG: hypothetical protein QOJ42_823, partial [Acidobacteriaceae bacterium]|nr:hypothetical protein [Acidobacteriaceae bacterium]
MINRYLSPHRRPAFMGIWVIGLLILPAGAASTADTLQTTEGGCSPVVSADHIEIICSGIDPRALMRLNELLDRQDLSLTQRTAEANAWAQKYEALKSQLEKEVRQKAARGENPSAAQAGQGLLREGNLEGASQVATLLAKGDVQRAEALVQSAVNERFGPLPIHLSLNQPSILERLSSYWKPIAGLLATLYVASFIILLLLTRRYTWAFRMISDAVWVKWLTWPFFLVRQFRYVQRWMLSPWFLAVSSTIQTDVPFLDPPVTSSSGSQIEGSTLFHRLRDTNRIWLQGRSGMGKSAVFTAWERAYFKAITFSSLDAAVRHYGLILVTIPVRYY